MKVIIALACVVVVLAEPPVRNTYYFAKQEDAPYPASGWKPDGAAFDLPQKQAPVKQYGAPERQYGAPVAPEKQYGGPVTPERQYGAPAARQFGGSLKNPSTQSSQQAPQRQYGSPTAPQNQYGAPSAPQNQYGSPSAPQNQYGAPASPQNQYGGPVAAPATPQNQYGTPAAPQNQYGTPSTPDNQYGTPQYPSESSTVTDYDETTFPTTESQAEPVDSVNELDEGNVDEQSRVQGEYFIALPDGRLQRVQYVSRQDIEAMKYFAKIRAENVEPLRGPIYAYQPLQKLQFAPANLETQGIGGKLQVPVAAKLQSDVAVPVASFSSLNYQPEQRFLINF